MKIEPIVDEAENILLVFQPIFNMTSLCTDSYDNDQVFCTNEDQDQFTLVNGVLKPKFFLTQNQWTRLRIINTAWNDFGFDFKFTEDTCELVLLAKGGIYLPEGKFPRRIASAPVPPAGRADIMVRCNGNGPFHILGYNGTESATVEIKASKSVKPTPKEFKSLNIDIGARGYLKDTMDVNVDPACSCRTILDSGSIGGGSNVPPEEWGELEKRKYTKQDRLHTAVEGKVQERHLYSPNHPYHQHVIPFQLKEIVKVENSAESGNIEPFFQNGDWHDVWQGFGIIRFNPVPFGGKMILHCHKLKHEDKGMMSTEKIAPHGSECLCGWDEAERDPDDEARYAFWELVGGLGISCGVIILAWWLFQIPWRSRQSIGGQSSQQTGGPESIPLVRS